MTQRKKAELILLSMTLIWGSTFVVMKIAFQYVSVFLFIAIRYIIGSIVFGTIFYRDLRKMTVAATKKGWMLGFLLGVGLTLQAFGLLDTTASKSAFITGTMVIFTPVVQIILERRIPKIGNILGVIIVTSGLYLLTSPSGTGFTLGDILTLIGAILFGIYLVYLDIVTKEENFLPIAFWQIVCTAVIGLSLLTFESVTITLNWTLVMVFLYMGVFATVVTTYMNTKYQKYTTPTRAAILFTFEPVISAILAYLILEERMDILGLIGGALIIIGILISELSDIWLQKFRWKLTIAEED
jgi:drug/metabolite transporter (DMT)-like permease